MHFPLRVKLILVMSFVVAGATIGTALVSLGVVRKAYEDKFESDFKAEVRYFSERQLSRLDDIRKRCEKLVQSDDLVAAMQKREPSQIRPLIVAELKEFYDTQAQAAPALLGQPRGGNNAPRGPLGRFGPGQGQGKGQGGGPPPQENRPPQGQGSGGNNKFIKGLLATTDRPTVAVVDAEGDLMCMLDPEGKLMNMDDARNVFAKRAGEKSKDKDKDAPGNGPRDNNRDTREQFKQSLKRLASHVDQDQELAYTTARGPDGKEHLREVIVTPVMAREGSAAVGAVIVSVLTSDLGERALHSFSQETDNAGKGQNSKEEGISSGFWLDGNLHTETIPASVRDVVSAEVAKRVNGVRGNSNFHETNIALDVDGEQVPHKLLFRVLNPDSPFNPACQVALYSLKDEIKEERIVQEKIMSIGLLALAVALGFILFVSRSMTKPLRELVTGTEQIRGGNYDVTIHARSRDELGQLAKSFNEMAQGLRLNQKYQRLLSQVADRMVAEQLINNEAALGGELREVSVLFCDIRGFTKLTAGMQPGEIIALLNEHMSALTAVVHDHFGVVDKFVGDMVMAIFGAPSAHGDDACRAAMCALRMVEVRDQLNEMGTWKFQVGIGIATGTVVAGCMGSEERLDYTVLGDRVNLASRLCGEAEPGEVLIDENTLAKLGDAPIVKPITDLDLKGYDDRVTAYRLTGWREDVYQAPLGQALDGPDAVEFIPTTA